jgi:Fic-DOC domain mobile mystery protein B
MGLDFQYQVGQTSLNKDEVNGLKIKSVTTQSELDELEQLNIEKAIEWTIHTKLNAERILTEKFVKNLHKKMYGDVWKWAGEFRKSDKNIGVQWSQISVKLKDVLDDTQFWIENNTYEPEEIAIRFKHRIVSIHCFPNGNGRHSRLIADIIIESIFGEDVFTWHKSNMIKADEVRKKYIDALRQADNRNITPLIDFAKS